MIDLNKTEFITTEFTDTQETRVVGKLLLAACVQAAHTGVYHSDIAQWRRRMVRDVRSVLWAIAYKDLIAPIKELQAKALYHAVEEADVKAVREICERIDKLLEYPK